MQSAAQQVDTPADDVSKLLRAWTEGDPSALERLTPIVHAELHRLANSFMKRERRGHSLQTTALVNEANLRLVGYKRNALARLDPRKVQVVEMRFFGGLSVGEIAEVVKVSPLTVMRDWSTARAWLYRELARETSDALRSMGPDR